MPDKSVEPYREMGGEFVSSPFLIKKKLGNIRAVLFDWDGVFHSGYKNEERSSTFSEADSMGVNMLRFGLYLQNGEMPFVAVISGENNPTALFWANREHLNAVFSGMKNKVEVLPVLKKKFGIEPEEVLFVFDDILDLSLAAVCGLRFLITKRANPLFIDYCRDNKLCDYISANDGGNFAVREVTEMALVLMGRFRETIEKRMDYGKDYKPYIATRNRIRTIKV